MARHSPHCDFVLNHALRLRTKGAKRHGGANRNLRLNATCALNQRGKKGATHLSCGASYHNHQSSQNHHPVAIAHSDSSRYLCPVHVLWHRQSWCDGPKDLEGACFADSIAVAVQGAYRCMSGNDIYDPCFASDSGSQPELACAQSPWSGVTLMKVTGALPPDVVGEQNPIASPWALQLANGQRCVVSTGAKTQL